MWGELGKMIIKIIILILAIPAGFLIAYLCKDELAVGRKWFRILAVIGFVLGAGFWVYGYYSEAWTSLFVMIVSFVSYAKSFDKRRLK